ncbi:SLC13/DASS family transporter [Flavobacteriaceae bacterium TP-CH-4]|uniref:SLC13/DASS family transporter n=1 Tax=Pelagihabitans pacificus TaxID=2696054 RepID=A0A967AWB5_9FLAO|nr:SLC13 family permease [Pelagihabitans pacificus]NHF61117.1 SLC13/DASS family transporter [Pelagihabitans pacificus]
MIRTNSKKYGIWIGLLLFLVVLLAPLPNGLPEEGQKTAAVAILMIIWWVSEAIPIYITAFLPVALFPFLGIMTSTETTKNYGHDYVLMLLGAFILAKGIENQRLHKRIALSTIKLLGTSKRHIILGFMLVTAFLSMWITNMAVVLIMLPIATALIQKEPLEQRKKFGLALLLGIAYAASIGGTGTLIGTPPNLVFAGLVTTLYPNAPVIDFLEWMKIGLPVVILFVPIVWFYLINHFKIHHRMEGGSNIATDTLKTLGSITKGEKRVFYIFLITALGWIFKKDLVLGFVTIPGWGSLLGVEAYIHDSTVALFGAIALFITSDGKGNRLMTWDATKEVPWGVAMFLGGGLALGAAFNNSGLAKWIGNSFTSLASLPDFIIILLIVGLIIFITEVNSNTATATIFLPILAAMAVAGSIHPLLVMIPATFACSFAFMLPSGTGTNTVIFASDQITIAEMAKTGFWLNLLFIFLLPLLLYFVILPLLGIDAEIPAWAN